nr:Chain B, Serine/threonine-protein kinase N2 [Homo sapiens]
MFRDFDYIADWC